MFSGFVKTEVVPFSKNKQQAQLWRFRVCFREDSNVLCLKRFAITSSDHYCVHLLASPGSEPKSSGGSAVALGVGWAGPAVPCISCSQHQHQANRTRMKLLLFSR